MLIVLFQAPLVWSLTRRLQRGHEEREALLGNAIAASARERRRVASYLHDGPVQDIAGLAFSLAPLADGAGARGERRGDALSTTIDRLRQTVRDLRALLVELHPPHLAAAGLEAAIATSSARSRRGESAWRCRCVGTEHLDREQEALVYRVAQEAVRNVIAYADAGSRARRLMRAGRRPARRRRRRPRLRSRAARAAASGEGHVGLSLVEELARDSGGSLKISSRQGEGTTRRARGAAPMIRVAVADDHGVIRDGLGGRDRGAAGHGARRDGRRRRRGGRGVPVSARPTSC